MDRRIIGGKGRTLAARRPLDPAAAPVPAVKSVTAATPQVLHLQVDEDSAGQRLDNYLMRRLKGVPKTHVYRVIRSGEVRVNKGRAAADTRVQAGDDVRVPPVRVAERPATAAVPAREFSVLFEDESLLAIDKPPGVAVHGGSGVSFGVIEQLRRARPTARFLELVHRLDRETSGVLLLAKKRSALTALQDQFRARDTGKTYAALVLGDWPDKLKVIDVPLHKYLKADGERRVRTSTADDAQAKRSITLVKVVQRFAGFTLAGREHQDRAHAPDPRASGACRPRHRRRRQVRRLRFQQVAGARQRAAGPALRRHVPARAAPGLRPPGQRRTHRTAGAVAGRLHGAAAAA